MTNRVVAYLDGFNLYYGLRSKGWQRYYWLDVRRLAENLLRPYQSLAAVHYFTARILPQPDDPDKQARQTAYLEALATLPDVRIHYGYYLAKDRRCSQCGTAWQTYEEKMTDVNIAVELLGDAQDDAFDTAILVSADSDLAGPVYAVQRRYPEKRVIAAFPPDRASKHLRRAVTRSFTIGRDALRDSLIAGPGHQSRRPRIDPSGELGVRDTLGGAIMGTGERQKETPPAGGVGPAIRSLGWCEYTTPGRRSCQPRSNTSSWGASSKKKRPPCWGASGQRRQSLGWYGYNTPGVTLCQPRSNTSSWGASSKKKRPPCWGASA